MASPDVLSSLLDAALDYARRGWPVFPCSPANKRPLLKRDIDPETKKPIPNSGGVTKATTDEATIRAWWAKWPRAMIGVSVGRAGMLVIDFDPRRDEHVDPETGEVTIEEWTLERLKAELVAQMGAAFPTGLAVRTPSGGVHAYFRMPEGEPIGNRGNLPDHIDVRGRGGYVIVPPSFCDGDASNARGPYRWLRGAADAPVRDMPAELVRILREPAAGKVAGEVPPPPAREPRFEPDLDSAHRSYALHALDGECRKLAGTPKGARNDGAYDAGFNIGQLVGAGALTEGVARAALIDVVRTFDPTAFERHVAAIDNGLTNGIAKPRDLSNVRSAARQTARDRDSGRAASPSAPRAPVDAYFEDAERFVGGPGPREGDESEPFQSGTVSEAIPIMGGGGRIVVDADPVQDRKCAFFRLTDLGNAERFRARHGWRFRFCNELGWFIWDDRRWELLSEEKDKVPGQVMLAVFATVRAIYNEADLIEASGLREENPDNPDALDRIVGWRGSGDNKTPILFSDIIRDHAKSSEGNGRIGCIPGLAKSFEDVAIKANAMDQDRMAINVLNGTLRLGLDGNRVAIVLHPHRPEDLISKVANVVYDPDATCPDYDEFLGTVQPDEKVRRFLHQWGGMSMTGDITEQKLAFFHGKGRNGKSTLVDAWAHINGDYGGSIGIESFLDQGKGRKGGEATPDLARLPGIRFLRTSEPEKGAKLAEALIKLITGGEPIDARHLNKGFFTFLPSFKVTVSGNHKPKITGHDDGIWRRVMLVPWEVQIPKDEVDRKLPEKLRKEASGMFNRLLEGLLDWRENGLIEPDAVLAATAKYREQSDQLGRFLDECVREVPGSRAKSSELFALFIAWAKANGAAEWQQVGFTKAMEDRGYENKRSNGIQWLDIEMVKSVSDFTGDSAGDGGEERPSPHYDDDYPA